MQYRIVVGNGKGYLIHSWDGERLHNSHSLFYGNPYWEYREWCKTLWGSKFKLHAIKSSDIRRAEKGRIAGTVVYEVSDD